MSRSGDAPVGRRSGGHGVCRLGQPDGPLQTKWLSRPENLAALADLPHRDRRPALPLLWPVAHAARLDGRGKRLRFSLCVIAQSRTTAARCRRASGCRGLKSLDRAGVLELIEDHRGGTYRAVYTVRFATTRATPKRELDLDRPANGIFDDSRSGCRGHPDTHLDTEHGAYVSCRSIRLTACRLVRFAPRCS